VLQKKKGKKGRKTEKEDKDSDSVHPVGRSSRGEEGMGGARGAHAGSNIVWVSLFARLTSGHCLLGAPFYVTECATCSLDGEE